MRAEDRRDAVAFEVGDGFLRRLGDVFFECDEAARARAERDADEREAVDGELVGARRELGARLDDLVIEPV